MPEARGLAGWLGLWRRLVGARVRSQMQYRLSFALQVVATLSITVLDFIAVALLLSRFGGLASWTLAEVALLYGLAATSFGLAELFGGHFDDFAHLIVRGDFDRYLIRPLPTFFQVMSGDFVLRRVGRVTQGLLALAFALSQVAAGWSGADWLLLAATLLGGSLFFLAILVFGATSCFWTAQTAEFANMFSYGGVEMLTYPMSIYEEWFRKLFTFVLPMAFINYYPVVTLLGKRDSLLPAPWLAWLAPAVCLAVFVIALRVWSWGVRRYQSTGS